MGQAGVVDLASNNCQKLELTSETECNEEVEIKSPTSRKKKNIAAPRAFVRTVILGIQKLPTHCISQVKGLSISRQIIFCTDRKSVV